MAQGRARLTALEVRQAKPPTDSDTRILADGGGLRLVVKKSGSKYWQFRTSRGGKETTLQLGSYPDVDLATARELADAERKKAAAGKNLVLERKLERLAKEAEASITLRSIAEELLAIKKRNGVSDSYRQKIEGALKATAIDKSESMIGTVR